LATLLTASPALSTPVVTLSVALSVPPPTVSLTDSTLRLLSEERSGLVLLRAAALRARLEGARAWDCAPRADAPERGPPLGFVEPLPREFAVFFERDVPWAILTLLRSLPGFVTPKGGRVIRAATRV
jgi:hypothetical protein